MNGYEIIWRRIIGRHFFNLLDFQRGNILSTIWDKDAYFCPEYYLIWLLFRLKNNYIKTEENEYYIWFCHYCPIIHSLGPKFALKRDHQVCATCPHQCIPQAETVTMSADKRNHRMRLLYWNWKCQIYLTKFR